MKYLVITAAILLGGSSFVLSQPTATWGPLGLPPLEQLLHDDHPAGTPEHFFERRDTAYNGTDLRARGSEPDFGIKGMRYCGIFPNGDLNDANWLIKTHLSGIETNHVVASGGCNRAACTETTGIYICNDGPWTKYIPGDWIAKAAEYVMAGCCITGAASETDGVMNGQQFTQWNWNVVVAYADCNADVKVKPSQIGGWGVNSSDLKCPVWAFQQS